MLVPTALKGQDEIAGGNATGKHDGNDSDPEGVVDITTNVTLSGSGL